MAVTHDMIAAKLSINRTTVTKALKGDPSIKQSTRKKVLDTATLMGYDFKQSQQNRREGKRFYIHEPVEIEIQSMENKDTIFKTTGLLTNLSTTGALLQLKVPMDSNVPLKSFLIDIKVVEGQDAPEIPLAKIIRINYYHNIEMATKFVDDQTISESVLINLENKAFSRVDQAQQANRPTTSETENENPAPSGT